MPSEPRSSNSYSPFHNVQNAEWRQDKLNAQVAKADAKWKLDAEREAAGKTPWWRRMFRRKPPLPYV